MLEVIATSSTAVVVIVCISHVVLTVTRLFLQQIVIHNNFRDPRFLIYTFAVLLLITTVCVRSVLISRLLSRLSRVIIPAGGRVFLVSFCSLFDSHIFQNLLLDIRPNTDSK